MQPTVLPSTLGDVLEKAAFEVLELGHDMLDLWHLLLAIMVLPKSDARNALEAQRIDKEDLRLLVAKWYSQQAKQSTNFVTERIKATSKLLDELQPIAIKETDHAAMSRFDGLLKAILANPTVAGTLMESRINPKDILNRLELKIVDE